MTQGRPGRPQKLHKVLADLGLGSRRSMERAIAEGRVAVAGRVAEVGERVANDADISVDGRPVPKPRPGRSRLLVMNKRAGVIVSRRDPEGRSSVFDELPPLRGGRWISVGRLDLQTTGLLLLANDGALAHRLAHPSTGIDREYAVRVRGKLSGEAIETLIRGVPVNGRRQAFSDLRYYAGSGANHWYHVVLMEGRNHEVRDLFDAVDIRVTRLKRVRYGPVALPPWLPRGAVAEMAEDEVAALRALVGLSKPRARSSQRRKSERRSERSLLIPYPGLDGRPDGPGS